MDVNLPAGNDDLARWQDALATREDVTIDVYPSLTHLFAGEGRSSPAEYEPTQHVDPHVITDIASLPTINNDPASPVDGETA